MVHERDERAPLAPFALRLRKAAELAAREETVTGFLARGKAQAASDATSLYPKTFAVQRFFQRFKVAKDLYEGHGEPTKEDLDVAAGAGKWSSRPSDLFLKMFADCLVTLQRDPLAGLVSPPLLGSEGTVPLSIVSVIPDIMQHYYDCIVLADHEVVLLTNYWQPSSSVNKIGAAMKELSKRMEGKGKKIIFKLLIDRGSIKQAVDAHVEVPPAEWKPLDIPLPHEIPNLNLEVQNYHRLIMGTMHTKFLLVDRIVCLLNSNNIQDRPNLEMMIHLEGPIVQSFYDTALLTWHHAMKPALPLLKQPHPKLEYNFAEDNLFLANIDLVKAAHAAQKILHRELADMRIEGQQRRGSSSTGFAEVVAAMQKARNNKTNVTLRHASTQPVVALAESRRQPSRSQSMFHTKADNGSAAPMNGSAAPEDAVSRPDEPNPTLPKLVNGDYKPPPSARKDNGHARSPSEPSVISNPGRAPSSAGSSRPATPAGQPSGDYLGAPPMSPQTPGAAMSPRTSELTAEAFTGRMRALSESFNAGANAPTTATLPHELYDDNRQFAPHRFHKAHKPVPIALVNRKPHGMPGHMDIRNPQDAAWLAGLRYAEKHVFIQTPTLNASKVIEGILKTCRRKVKVILYLDLGFNDKSESFLFQGGTNQKVVKKLFAALAPEHKEYLELYWYAGADQYRPLHAIHKRRNCHVKFMSIDSKVAIVGNGNQDTQSWCHSQEVNIMIDSEQIVQDWEAMLAANQNTGRFGRTGQDGIWRDQQGRTVEQLDEMELKKVTPKVPDHEPPVREKKEELLHNAAA